MIDSKGRGGGDFWTLVEQVSIKNLEVCTTRLVHTVRKEVYSGPGGLPCSNLSLDIEMRLKGGLNFAVS